MSTMANAGLAARPAGRRGAPRGVTILKDTGRKEAFFLMQQGILATRDSRIVSRKPQIMQAPWKPGRFRHSRAHEWLDKRRAPAYT